MSTHNIGFYEDLTKIIFELSSNTHLLSSAAVNFTKPHQLGAKLSQYLRQCTNICICSTLSQMNK